jgi:hypothetical protein
VSASRESLIIGEAVFLVCLGLLTWRLSHRWRDLPSGPTLLVGLPGLYLVTLHSFYHAPLWLDIPGGVLFVSSYFVQMAVWRRLRAKSATSPAGTDGPA